jgi:hypothetical protein
MAKRLLLTTEDIHKMIWYTKHIRYRTYIVLYIIGKMFQLCEIIQVATVTACVYGLVNYKNALKSYLGSLCINIIYWYSYAEIYTKSVMSEYMLITDDTVDNDNCMVYYIKDGISVTIYDEPKHKQPIPFSEDMDVLIYTTPTLNVVVLDDSEKVFDLHKIKSDTEFINMTVIFEDDPKHYDILLRTNTSDFYAMGNHINKYIVWSLVLNQHNVLRNGRDYTLQVIDHNVNITSYTQDMSIVIQKEGYYTIQTECETPELLCEQSKGLDK